MQGENAMTVIAILEHGRGHSQWAVQIQCGGVGIASIVGGVALFWAATGKTVATELVKKYPTHYSIPAHIFSRK